MSVRIRKGRPGRRDILRLVLAAGAVSLSATRGRAQTSSKPDTIRIGHLTAARAWVVGKSDGRFDKALGAKIEWAPFPSEGPALSLLAAKQIDFAIFGNTPIVAGLSRKLPIQILGSPEIVATSQRLVAKPGIAALKDLEASGLPRRPLHHGLRARGRDPYQQARRRQDLELATALRD